MTASNQDNNLDQKLIPTIIQDFDTGKVLMLGYSNDESLQKTRQVGLVTFYSRSKQRLWTKGETSGNFLQFKSLYLDCDEDTILIKAVPVGPTCHTGKDTCFGEHNSKDLDFKKIEFLADLEKIINNRKLNPSSASYISSLFKDGHKRIAQKVGEEGVEVAIEASCLNDKYKTSKSELNLSPLLEEGADLLFHFMILLSSFDLSLSDVVSIMEKRNQNALQNIKD